MSSIAHVAVSGMQAAQTQLRVTAHNVANMVTPTFRRQEVVQTPQPQGGVSTTVTRSDREGPSPVTDMAMQLQARNAFLVNLAVFRTDYAMTGTLLNERA